MKQWICNVCGYVYEEADFLEEANDYVCPLCDASKEHFEIRDVVSEIQIATNEINN